jgi:hypothetical protein
VPFQTLHNGRELYKRCKDTCSPTPVQRVLMCNVRSISTGHLHHSHGFQIRPINPRWVPWSKH